MKILGLDVSRNWAIVVVLCEFPEISPLQYAKKIGEPQKGYSLKKGSFPINEIAYKIQCDRDGLELLKSLNADVIVLEPTGTWYASFWVNAARNLGIQYRWVSHQQVKLNRSHYFKTQNKDDYLDAFTMALTYFDRSGYDEHGEPPLMKHFDHERIDLLRRTFHEREQLDKNKNTLINQLRQRLSAEHPEICQRNLDYIGVNGFNPTLAHIAGLKKNGRIGESVGTGIEHYTRRVAADIIEYHQRLNESEGKLAEILADPEFYPYTRVFCGFGYGLILSSLLLLHVYPIERFFVNGKPYWKGNHDHSLRRFQAYLGLAYSHEISGDTSAKQDRIKKSWKGSDLVRSHLYVHALATICTNHAAKNETLAKLKNAWFNPRTHIYYERNPKTDKKERKQKEMPAFKALGKDGICRLLFYETRLLYQELIKL